jgi:hypothetical protein
VDRRRECYPYWDLTNETLGVSYPIPIATIKVKTKDGVKRKKFLVDTGSDLTTLPKNARQLFATPLQPLSLQVFGLEGSGMDVYIGRITLVICGEEIEVRAHFTETEKIPFILGRLDICDKFDLHFVDGQVCFERREEKKTEKKDEKRDAGRATGNVPGRGADGGSTDGRDLGL